MESAQTETVPWLQDSGDPEATAPGTPSTSTCDLWLLGPRLGVQGAHYRLWAWRGRPSCSLEGEDLAWGLAEQESGWWGQMPGLAGTRQGLAPGIELAQIEAGPGMGVGEKQAGTQASSASLLLLSSPFPHSFVSNFPFSSLVSLPHPFLILFLLSLLSFFLGSVPLYIF